MRPLLSTPHHGNGHDLIDPRAHETRNQIVFSGGIAAVSLITRDTDGLFHVHLVYNNPPLCLLNTTAIRGEQLAVHRAAELIDTGHTPTVLPLRRALEIPHYSLDTVPAAGILARRSHLVGSSVLLCN